MLILRFCGLYFLVALFLAGFIQLQKYEHGSKVCALCFLCGVRILFGWHWIGGPSN